MRTIYLSVEEESVCANNCEPIDHEYLCLSLVPWGTEEQPTLIGPIHKNKIDYAFAEVNKFLMTLGFKVVTFENCKGRWEDDVYTPHPSEVNDSEYSVRLNQDVWEITVKEGDEVSTVAFVKDEEFALQLTAALSNPLPDRIIHAAHNAIERVVNKILE